MLIGINFYSVPNYSFRNGRNTNCFNDNLILCLRRNVGVFMRSTAAEIHRAAAFMTLYKLFAQNMNEKY